jgi:rubrerythrin
VRASGQSPGAFARGLRRGIQEDLHPGPIAEECIEMSLAFNADEVFAMAEQLEQNGARFYRTAAGQADDAAAKDLLLTFAAMEDDHLQTFAAMRAALSRAERAGAAFDPQEEASLYLAALVNTRVFFDKEVDATGLQGIFTTAMAAEKDSILFYLGMKDLVPESLGRGQVEEIIREEMRHVQILGERLASL